MTASQNNDDPVSAAGSGRPRKPAKRGPVRSRKVKAEDAPVDTRPAPEVREVRETEVPAPRPVREKVADEPQASREESPRPEKPIFQPPAGSGGGDSGAGGDRSVSSEPTPGQSQQRSAPGNGGESHSGHGGGGGGGGHGEWQDRNSWRRNKRKRGRFGGGAGGGGSWQQGQTGGGGGGGRSPHPQQPPPPSQTVPLGDLPDAAQLADLAALDARAADLRSGSGPAVEVDRIYAMNLADLTAYARQEGVTFEGLPNRRQLLPLIFAQAAAAKRPIIDHGYIDLTDRGAFIVHEHANYRLYPEDSFLPESLIRRYGLKRGHRVTVQVQAPAENERCPAVVQVQEVMGKKPEDISKVTPFEELIPYYPLQRILLEAPEVQKDVSMRAVDILTPIGFGQRGLIVAPPRTGKTILLQNIANSISENSPEVKLILLLIDERPEEVTDFRRHTKGEVVSSTFDEAPESHVHCAEMVGEKARRLVEDGQHVVILLDSITRLARAYNALTSNAGKIMSGGLEATALQKPKRFFGAARNIEGGGSLTIIATALIDTGSRADEVIFEEFKGTGNMELHLDRGLVERRIFPAINIDRSGTRKEELIYHPEELQRIYGLRRAMQGLGPIESMEMLIQRLKKTKSNAEFLMTLSRQ